jgi:glycosyltransferase involved in cell wall biosynthesis
VLLRERPYGLIVSHDYGLFSNGRAAARLAHSASLPYVSEIFHVPGHPRAADLTERAEKMLYRLYIQWAKGRASAFRAGNEQEIPDLYRTWGVPPQKIQVLPSHYLDLNTFAPQPITKEADVIFVGRLVKNKGIFLLLDALALAKQRKPDISLHIVGEGPLQPALTRHIEKRGIRENVRFLGWLPDQAAVARAYNAARVVVCASFNEGGPRTPLEGMACGLPAVSTPVGAMPEVIASGENGYLVDWNPESFSAALLTVLENESLQRRLGSAARAAVQPFAYGPAIRRYAEGYLRLIDAI